MAGPSGFIKLNANNISVVSLGHVDTDPHFEGEKSFKRLNAEEDKSTTQPTEISVLDHQNQNQRRQDEEHVKAYGNIFGSFYKFARLLGIELSFGWKPTTHLSIFFTFFLVTFAWVCIFYTQVKHIINGQAIRVLEPFGAYGTTFSCVQKLVGYLCNRDEVISVFLCIRSICLKTLPGSRADIIKSYLTNTLTLLKVFAVSVVAALGIFVVGSLKDYIVHNELVSLLPIDVMFVNMTSTKGFLFANCMMSGMGIWAALGIILYDGVFIFAIFMYSMKVELIEQDLKDLDEMWANDSTVTYKHALLLNVCKKRQDLNRFFDTVKGIFERKIFVYFCLNYFSQIVCLFEVTTRNWTPGYAIALVSFLEMMFYCVLGTKINIAVCACGALLLCLNIRWLNSYYLNV